LDGIDPAIEVARFSGLWHDQPEFRLKPRTGPAEPFHGRAKRMFHDGEPAIPADDNPVQRHGAMRKLVVRLGEGRQRRHDLTDEVEGKGWSLLF
jgi:hypothetical protein